MRAATGCVVCVCSCWGRLRSGIRLRGRCVARRGSFSGMLGIGLYAIGALYQMVPYLVIEGSTGAFIREWG